jgi:hypothetical protein
MAISPGNQQYLRFSECPRFSTLFIGLLLLISAAHLHANSMDQALGAFRAGYYELAARDLRISIAKDPYDLQALYWLARCEIATGDFIGAETHLRQVLAQKPQAVESRYWLGEALAGQNRLSEAESAYQQVLAANPGYVLATQALEQLSERPANVEEYNPRGRSGFSVTGLDLDFNAAELLSSNVYDYTFSSAPTDWLARGGLWNATNRWSCSPQWSWYGGYSPTGIAALWNKREFVGDIVVELYCAFTMRQGRNPSYLPPNDVNITICGDGANPDSGYSFIVGGDDNRVTRIMRGTQVLAETHDRAALFPIYEDGQPAMYDWHRKWWSVRVRKSGTKLGVYLDNNLVLEAEDPAPLSVGRVGIWTIRNDIVTPRIKVYYEQENALRSPMPDDIPLPTSIEVASPELRLSSSTHPSLQENFENGPGVFRTRDGDQGADLAIVPGGSDGSTCLRLSNPAAGGSFAFGLHRQQFDAADLSRLSFDYRISPEAKVNLYVASGGERYQITFTGPDRAAPGCIRLGSIADVKTDNHWHSAEFDLLGHLKALMPDRQSFVCTDLWFGVVGNPDYLMAGFGGNRVNTTWYMDNFMIGRPGGTDLKLEIVPLATGVKGYSIAVSHDPHEEPPARVTTEDRSVTLQLADEGTSYVHVRPLLADDQWGPRVTYRACVDHQPPIIVSVAPQPGATLADGIIRVAMDDPGGSGVDLEALQVRFNDKPLSIADGALTWEPQLQTLHIDLGAGGIALEDSQSATLELDSFTDLAGNAAEPQRFSFTVDHRQDRRPPSAPTISIGDSYLVDDTFEHDMGRWAPAPGQKDVLLHLDDTTSAEGNQSLRIYNSKWGNPVNVRITDKSFDAGKHRIVSFFYKLDDRIRVDFGFLVNGQLKAVRFTDNDNPLPIIGRVPDVQTDGQWHYAEFNLYEMLKRADSEAQKYNVTTVSLADWGHAGNREGSHFWIDSFRIIPVVSSAEPVALTWGSTDASGVAGLSWAATPNPVEVAPREVMADSSPTPITLADTWLQWVTAQVMDRAGNWSPMVRRPILADGNAPIAAISGPPVDSVTAVSQITLNLYDTGPSEIDPSSIVLQVGGQEYTVDNEGLHYDRQKRQLLWNCEHVSPEPVVFDDGHEVQIALVRAADYAGNPVVSLPSWSWTMSYAADREGPVIRQVTSATHATLVSHTFENGLGGWANTGGANGAEVSLDSTTAASGNASVKLTGQRPGGTLAAIVYNGNFSAEQYPYLTFDYKIPDGVKLDVAVMMDGRWRWIVLTGQSQSNFGSFENVVADNTWQHATFNLGAALRRQKRQGPLTVTQIMVSNPSGGNAEGAVANFDNFFVGNTGNRSPIMRWAATDTTGIQAYSYILDQNPFTMPEETSLGQATAKQFERPEPGLWYFHLRAQDGAGNWGPTTTYTLMHGRP